MEKNDCEEYRINGIPNGYVVFKKMQYLVDNISVIGYLIAGKDYNKNIAYVPILYKIDASKEEIATKYKEQENKLLEYYNKL